MRKQFRITAKQFMLYLLLSQGILVLGLFFAIATGPKGLNEDAMMDTTKKMMSGKFTLKDMYAQMEAMGKMGPLKKIMSLIPGMAKMEDQINYEESQKKLAQFKCIMDSMTDEEQEDPSIIKASRVNRIAMGSGTTAHDVKELLKQFNQSKKAVKGMMGNRKMRKQLMKQMGMSDLDLDSLGNDEQ